jgi:hypothetical protein
MAREADYIKNPAALHDTHVLGLGGEYRAGKDAVADILVSDYGWFKMGMSDALHYALLTLNPWIFVEYNVLRLDKPDSYLYGGRHYRYEELNAYLGYVEMKKIPEVRQILQRMGTEVGREMFGENVWVDLLLRNIENLKREFAYPGIVVTGVRYRNEIAALHKIKARTAYVERPGLEKPQDASVAHSSENSLSKYDFTTTILNGGSLEDLKGTVGRFVEWLGARS